VNFFIMMKPRTTIEPNHNKEALAILETKKSRTVLLNSLIFVFLSTKSGNYGDNNQIAPTKEG
jgi:hypothetical protein